MNEQIMKILPAELPYENIRENEDLELHFALGYNRGINDCAAAIEKANLVRCPTEEELAKYICSKTWRLSVDDSEKLAKALLALLRGEK